MSYKIPLIRAVQRGLIRYEDFINYIPDKSSVTFTRLETHSYYSQTAETEYDLGGFHTFSHDEHGILSTYLIPTHCSKFKLEILPIINEYCPTNLRRVIGENQLGIGPRLLERYATLYDSKELKLKAIPFSERLFTTMGWRTWIPEDCYYLSNTFSYEYLISSKSPFGCSESSFGQSFEGIKKECDLYMGLKWVSFGVHSYVHETEPITRASIRIAIPVDLYILVELDNPDYDGSSPEKAYRIFRKKKGSF